MSASIMVQDRRQSAEEDVLLEYRDSRVRRATAKALAKMGERGPLPLIATQKDRELSTHHGGIEKLWSDRIRTGDVQLGKLEVQCSKCLSEHGDMTLPPVVVPRLVPSEPENTQEDKLEAIAEMLRELSPEDRARLGDMLGDQDR